MKFLLIYLFTINALGLLLMHIDKHKAKKNLWRIPEVSLLVTAALGGSLGCLLGMHTAHHKTKHLKFTLGIPVILAAQVVFGVLLYTYFR